jgi:hypothetical protein
LNVGIFGIVSSVIVKAYPLLDVAESTVAFVGGNVTVPTVVNNPSATLGSNYSVSMPVIVKDLDNFWRGVDVVYAFRKDMVDGGGTTYNCVSNTGNNTFDFTTLVILRMSKPDISKFLQPLAGSLNTVGIAVNNTTSTFSSR